MLTGNACRACARLLVLDAPAEHPESLGDDILIDDAAFLQTSELEWYRPVVVKTTVFHHGFFSSLQESSMIMLWWSPHTTLQRFASCEHICRRLHRPLKNSVMTLQRFNGDCEGEEASLAIHLPLSFVATQHSAFTECSGVSNVLSMRVHSIVRLGNAEHMTVIRR
jgi:hypothetical protein